MTETHPGYACSQCGNLQPTSAACDRCKFDVLLDVSRESVRELLALVVARKVDARRL